MDIQVKKLDLAYSSTIESNHSIKEKSIKLSDELIRILNNINEHWRGEDATLYINRWIDEYELLSLYFNNLNKEFNYLQNYFVTLQICRSRTTNIKKIGENINEKIEFTTISKKDITNEYYFDMNLEKDFNDLELLFDYYSDFIKEIGNNMEIILRNWLIGNGRKEIIDTHKNIEELSKKILNDMKMLNSELAIMIVNLKRIND